MSDFNLTIDIGNSNIMFCLFFKKKIIKYHRVSSKINFETKYLDKLITNLNKGLKNYIVTISSVVEDKNCLFKSYFASNNVKCIFVDKFFKRFKINTFIKNKSEIGSDRLVNVIYSLSNIPLPTLILDFGTATTIDYLNVKGVYEGGVILPGIDLSLKSLNISTSKLPLVKFQKTKKIIGNTTKSAIKSGFYWGYVSMINGLISKISKEKITKPNVVVTGGNSNFFKSEIKKVYLYDEFFIMKGLNFIGKKCC